MADLFVSGAQTRVSTAARLVLIDELGAEHVYINAGVERLRGKFRDHKTALIDDAQRRAAAKPAKNEDLLTVIKRLRRKKSPSRSELIDHAKRLAAGLSLGAELSRNVSLLSSTFFRECRRLGVDISAFSPDDQRAIVMHLMLGPISSVEPEEPGPDG